MPEYYYTHILREGKPPGDAEIKPMSPPRSFLFPACFLFFAAPVSPARADDPPPAPSAPVAETPDFQSANWVPAAPENFKPSTRPSAEQPIDRIVIHDIEGPAMSAVRWFQNPKAQVSSHYVIDAVTGTVYQQVKERDIAWHAGDRITNARSVGIEHGGYAYRPGFFSTVQYEASAKLVRDISRRHNIPRDREHIIGHFEVPDSANPGKFGGRGGHTDPGPYWDWDYFMTLIRNYAARPPYLSGMAPVPALPLIMHPGEVRAATFPDASPFPADSKNAPTLLRLENTGDDPWLSDRKDSPSPDRREFGTVYLGTADGRNSLLAAADWISPRYVGSSVDGDVAPGSFGNFAMTLRAPRDFLGDITESFRLIRVPVAPLQPVPFGEGATITVRVVPWDIVVPLPQTPPPGWEAKIMPDGTRVFWRKVSPLGRFDERMPKAQPLHWETYLPVAGEWDVYVRYPAGRDRSSEVTYKVSDPYTPAKRLNQRVGGGVWRKLGRYLLNADPKTASDTKYPDAAPTGTFLGLVSLNPNEAMPGVVVAGDVRFVGPFPSAE